MFLITTVYEKYIEKRTFFSKCNFFIFQHQNFFFLPLPKMFLSSFCINIQRYSSIGRRSIKIVRGSGSGTIFSTLSQSNLNSRSSNIDKTWGKSYSTQIMNFGKKKNLVSVYKKKFFFTKNSYKNFIVSKNIRFFWSPSSSTSSFNDRFQFSLKNFNPFRR